LPLQGPGTVQLDAIDDADAGTQSEAAAGKYFRWLAGTAAAAGVSVDVFAVGNSAANVAALAPVAERSGGLLVLQEGESAVHFSSWDSVMSNSSSG
jgi:Sec23/Sec24 trunk domain